MINFYVIMGHYEYEDNSKILGVHTGLSSAIRQLNEIKHDQDLFYNHSTNCRTYYDYYTLDIVIMQPDKENNCFTTHSVHEYIEVFFGCTTKVNYISNGRIIKKVILEDGENIVIGADGG